MELLISAYSVQGL